MPARPARQRLLSGSCSSARSFAPRFLPTLGRPHAVALHFVRCDQLTAGLAPAGVRPCRAHMEQNDTLVVSKLDRIGRDAIDVQQTVELFKKRGIRLVVLQLGNIDLTSSAGELTVAILSAMAQFERSILIERVQAGLQRARNEGKRLGRPAKTNTTQRLTIVERRADGVSVSQLARDFSVSRATILSITAA